jgi:hypothetical protein
LVEEKVINDQRLQPVSRFSEAVGRVSALRSNRLVGFLGHILVEVGTKLGALGVVHHIVQSVGGPFGSIVRAAVSISEMISFTVGIVAHDIFS